MTGCQDVNEFTLKITDQNMDLLQITREVVLNLNQQIRFNITLQESMPQYPNVKIHRGNHLVSFDAMIIFPNKFVYSHDYKVINVDVDFCYNRLKFLNQPTLKDMIYVIGQDPIEQKIEKHIFTPENCKQIKYQMEIQGGFKIPNCIYLDQQSLSIRIHCMNQILGGQELIMKVGYEIENKLGICQLFTKVKKDSLEFEPELGFTGTFEISVILKDKKNSYAMSKYTFKVNVIPNQDQNETEIKRIQSIKQYAKSYLKAKIKRVTNIGQEFDFVKVVFLKDFQFISSDKLFIIPELYEIKGTLPPQVSLGIFNISNNFTEFIGINNAIGASIQYTMTTVFGTNLLLNLFLQGYCLQQTMILGVSQCNYYGV
ncbi:UNKNOWN [Stylonychia lemnae]|uniref:Uncharacterized protein n=1 Tax=Stylonychia lemnae TaxID=5949 RepID=A0A077ZPL1_STYLE|nr:UNKNOWN [Stylonychia lemnae]|eukprot:CDW71399.1 UNKNOWN [Stylonychia lemnae]